MTNGPKIKDLYHCTPDPDTRYSLQQWYNAVIEKSENEVTVADVLRMMRQKMFIETAVKRAVTFLEEDPFANELWVGDLFDHLAELDKQCLLPYAGQLSDICRKAVSHARTYELFEFDFEIENYLHSVSLLSSRLAEWSA